MFDGFFLGGFECASHAWADGARVDSIAGTAHDARAAEDYALLRRHGFGGARDGLRWHLIEATPGRFDWSSWLPMLRAARDVGLPVIWDLVHWGVPDGLDVMSPAFVTRAAQFATEAARLHRSETDAVPMWVAVNELSFWAWAGGDAGGWPPYRRGEGAGVKRQLVRAAIAISHAVRAVDPRAVLVTAEPLIAVHAAGGDRAAQDAAAGYEEASHEAVDMLLGRRAAYLGGAESLVDIIGVNYYPANQFYPGGAVVPAGDHRYRPPSDLIVGVFQRYGRPVLIAETGCEGDFRPAWLKYMSESAQVAADAGVPVAGLCLYPILDYPGWENGRKCPAGLFDGLGDRTPYAPMLDELRRQSAVKRPFHDQVKSAISASLRTADTRHGLQPKLSTACPQASAQLPGSGR